MAEVAQAAAIPEGVGMLSSFKEFQTEIARSDVITCVAPFSTDSPMSCSDKMFEQFEVLSLEPEVQKKVQFFRINLKDVPEVIVELKIYALPMFCFFWEGVAVHTLCGSNMEKAKLMAKHCIQKRYIKNAEREKEEKDRKAAEEEAEKQAASATQDPSQ
jgi:thioredoxin-like negative regulator of GroEL